MTARLSRPTTNRHAYNACLEGLEPAEALPSSQRDLLVMELHSRGWTDVEVATHARMTTYTAARIRRRLGLPVNFAAWEVA